MTFGDEGLVTLHQHVGQGVLRIGLYRLDEVVARDVGSSNNWVNRVAFCFLRRSTSHFMQLEALKSSSFMLRRSSSIIPYYLCLLYLPLTRHRVALYPLELSHELHGIVPVLPETSPLLVSFLTPWKSSVWWRQVVCGVMVPVT